MTLKAYCLFESHWIPGLGNDRGSTYVCLFLIFPPPPTRYTNPRLLSAGSSAWLDSHQSHQSIRAHGLGALQGEAQGSTPHQLSQHAEGSGHTEEHRVVIHLSHSIVLYTGGVGGRETMSRCVFGTRTGQLHDWKGSLGSHLQQHSTVSVHVGPGVLGLTLLQQHIGDNLVKLGDQLEHGVIGKMLQGKFTLAGVTWVRLPQDSMTIAWYHLQPIEETYPKHDNCANIQQLFLLNFFLLCRLHNRQIKLKVIQYYNTSIWV